MRDAGANVLVLGRRIGLCAKSIVGAGNPSFVVAVELRELRISFLSDTARLALLESSLSQRHAMTNEHPMQIVRYRYYPQSDLSADLDRLTNMRAEMDRVFESTGSFSASPAPLSRWNPAVNVYQDKDRFTVVVELPGLKKEEIEISLHDDTLTIAGERKREVSSEQEFLTERLYGKFQRSLTLPTAVDAERGKATYQDGLLQVVLPKVEEAKPKQIEVALK